MSIYVNKQSSIMIRGEKTVYFDLWDLPEGSPKADLVFVTHPHSDHFQPRQIASVCTDKTILIVPKSMRSEAIVQCGIEESRCIGLEPGDKCIIGTVPVEAAAAYNVGKQFHKQQEKWCGYVVTLDNVRYYVTGDTDANPDNRAVKCDVLLVPVGGKYTMNVEEAVRFTKDLSPKKAIPTHYGEVVGNPADGERFARLLSEQTPAIEAQILLS